MHGFKHAWKYVRNRLHESMHPKRSEDVMQSGFGFEFFKKKCTTTNTKYCYVSEIKRKRSNLKF